LIEAKSAHATAKEDLNRQINDLNRRITQSESEKQASSQQLSAMTNQIAELTNQIASAQASLLQANKDYALLENRFLRDVAERVIVERKFNNRTELKAQLEYLQWSPASEISEQRIREGLNVVVGRSNLCYVIAPE
jgi:predicted  nucleic acid-binding Zn-ribbon protein